MLEPWVMILGSIVIPLLVAATAFWWRVESDQNKKLEKLRDCNGREHKELRKEIDNLKSTGHDQHVELLDKVTEVWQHMVKGKR